MYLLDTQALADLVSGGDNATRSFASQAEAEDREVRVSVISLGALRAEIDAIIDPAERENWDRRFQITFSRLRSDGRILDVELRISLEWAILKNMGDLVDKGGREIGDDERLVIATAIIERLILVTSSPERYLLPHKKRGLQVKTV
jgi:predicted nucleic acid-binding protein